MQQPLQVNHPGKPLSDSYALIAYQTVPINLDGSKSTHSICMGMRLSVEKTLRPRWEKSSTVRLCNSMILIKGTSPNSASQISRCCCYDPHPSFFFFFLCLDSLAEAIAGGPSVFTKTLKPKQTDQCDNKERECGGARWVCFCVMWPCPLIFAAVSGSSARSMLRFSSLSREAGVKTLTFSTQQ